VKVKIKERWNTRERERISRRERIREGGERKRKKTKAFLKYF